VKSDKACSLSLGICQPQQEHAGLKMILNSSCVKSTSSIAKISKVSTFPLLSRTQNLSSKAQVGLQTGLIFAKLQSVEGLSVIVISGTWYQSPSCITKSAKRFSLPAPSVGLVTISCGHIKEAGWQVELSDILRGYQRHRGGPAASLCAVPRGPAATWRAYMQT
jgi:hypothetical protein